MIVPRFEIRRSRISREWYFVLIAKNGKIVAHGEHYRTRAGCRKGIRAVTEAVGGYSAELVVVDTTEAPR